MVLVYPQNLKIAFANQAAFPTPTTESGLPLYDLSVSGLKFTDGVGGFVPALPQHTLTGEHGPKVSITQTGADNALSITQLGNSPSISVLCGVGAGRGLSITQAAAQDGALINKSSTGVGAALSVANSGSGNAVSIANNTTSTSAVGIVIDQSAAATGIRINENGNGTALYISKSNTGNATLIDVYNTGTGRALFIQQYGEAEALHVNKTSAGASVAVSIYNAGINAALAVSNIGDGDSIIVSKSTGVNGNPIRISNSGTNSGMLVTQYGNAEGIKIQQSGTIGAGALTIICTHTAGVVDAIRVTQSNSGSGMQVTLPTDGSDGVYILKTNTLGPGLASGACLSIRNSSGATPVLVRQVHTGSATVVSINNSGSGFDIRGNDGTWYATPLGDITCHSLRETNGTAGIYRHEDSGWLPAPMSTSFNWHHAKNSDVVMVWGQGFSGSFGNNDSSEFIFPMMGTDHSDYIHGYNQLDLNHVYSNGKYYTHALENARGLNVGLDCGMIRYMVVNKAANYDSGWTACAQNTTYTRNHGLGVYPNFVLVEVAQNNDGSGWRVPVMSSTIYNGSNWVGAHVNLITTTQIRVRVPPYVASFYSYAGVVTSPTAGFLRVRAWNWTPDYDSGWSSISNAASNCNKYLEHGLGYFPTLANLYLSDSATPAAQTWTVTSLGTHWTNYHNGSGIVHMTDKWASVRGGNNVLAHFIDAAGAAVAPTSGFYRLQLWK